MEFRTLVKSKFTELSKSQQKIAKYIMDNLEEVVFDTADQLGKKNDVSETTIIRFSYALGFERFSDMTKAMKESVTKGKEVGDGGRGVSLSRVESCETVNFIEAQLKSDRAYGNMNMSELKDIADLIMSKKKILIIGYMDSFGAASELLHVLDKVRSKVYFYRLLFEERNMLYEMDEDSLLITISFSPHYKYTLEHTETAKKGGCSVVTFTDNIISPYTKLADKNLIFNLERNTEIELIDMSPVTKFIYYLSNYLYANYREKINEYRNSIERRIEQYIEE